MIICACVCVSVWKRRESPKDAFTVYISLCFKIGVYIHILTYKYVRLCLHILVHTYIFKSIEWIYLVEECNYLHKFVFKLVGVYVRVHACALVVRLCLMII